MKTYEEISDAITNIQRKLKNSQEIGLIELSDTLNELEELRRNVDYNDESTYKNVTIDTDDKREMTLYSKELIKDIDELEDDYKVLFDNRKSLLDVMYEQYSLFKELRRDKKTSVIALEMQVRKNSSIQSFFNDKIYGGEFDSLSKNLENLYNEAVEEEKKFSSALMELGKKCLVLLDGGKVNFLKKDYKIEEVKEIINRDLEDINTPLFTNNKPVVTDRKKVVVKEEPKEEVKEEKVEKGEEIVEEEAVEEVVKATPKTPTKKFVLEKREEPSKEEAKLLSLDTIKTTRRVAPEPEPTEEEIKLESALSDTDKEEKAEEPKGLKPLPNMSSAEKALFLKPDEEEKVEKEELKEKVVEKASEEESEEVGEAQMGEEAVEGSVHEPKDKLWKKIGKVIKKAIIYLSLGGILGTAVHSGLTAHNTAKIAASLEQTIEDAETEVENETEKDVSESDVMGQFPSEVKDEPTHEAIKEEIKEEKPAEIVKEEKPIKEVKEEVKEETKEEEKTEEDIKKEIEEMLANNTNNIELPQQEYPTIPVVEEKTEEKPTQVVKEETKEEPKEEYKEEEMKIALQPGESVYNEATGVEVGYSGAASLNGQRIDDKDLEYNNGTAYVTTGDLVADNQSKSTENHAYTDPNALPRTGLEVSEEEYREGKSEQELANLDDAIGEAFLQFLEDNGKSR